MNNVDLRDYFAAAALQGMLAENGGGAVGNDGLAETAYAVADAMLAARAPKHDEQLEKLKRAASGRSSKFYEPCLEAARKACGALNQPVFSSVVLAAMCAALRSLEQMPLRPMQEASRQLEMAIERGDIIEVKPDLYQMKGAA